MSLISLSDDLKLNVYPGRGIVIGLSQDGENAVIAYFIMGRSQNSRNRIFKNYGDEIKTKAFDPSKLTDPSLIIYSPVRAFENTTIVTNGNQTDTIYDFLVAGKSFEDALCTRTFEPDSPNFTPRISGVLQGNKGSYKLSILKSMNGNENSVERFFFDYPQPVSGIGHFIHTYKCDGDPIPSFAGEPKAVNILGSIDEFTDDIWNSLNYDNKVSLFTRFISLKTGEKNDRIKNKNNGD